MLTWIKRKQLTNTTAHYEGHCLSTDTKPTYDYIGNGSILLELDTSTLYFYDASGKVWRAWA